MRLHWIILSIPVVLATSAIIVAETNIDLAAVSMPPSLALLVCGVVLVVVGTRIRKSLRRPQVPKPEVAFPTTQHPQRFKEGAY